MVHSQHMNALQLMTESCGKQSFVHVILAEDRMTTTGPPVICVMYSVLYMTSGQYHVYIELEQGHECVCVNYYPICLINGCL